MAFYSLKALLPAHLQRAGIKKQVDAVLLLDKYMEAAEEMLGKNIASKTKALYFRDGVLVVACQSSALNQELRYIQEDLLKIINKKSGGSVVKKIKFEVN